MNTSVHTSGNSPRPPLAPGYPLIGSALHTRHDPREFLMQQYKTLGPIFRLNALHIRYIIMAGPAANQFSNIEGRDFFESHTFWKGMMHELEADNFLIGLDGENHTMLRKLFKNEFSKSGVDLHRDMIRQLCVDMFADIKPGDECIMVERVLQLTSQMIGCIMTGKIPSREELSAFLYYVNDITNHFNLKRLPAWLLALKSGRFREARASTLAFAESVVQEKLTGKDGIHNFVDAVLEASRQCPHLFKQGDIRFSAILPLFAGIDTLGQTLNYALFELHRHPDILAKVQEEVDHFFTDGTPDTTQLKDMELLNSVIMETLRLHPSAFGMVRTANRDFVFEGHQVRKGEDVVILTTASHFDERHFADPYQFDITRFMAPRFEHRARNVFAPFGRGPHTCLGAGMAESLMALTLGSILHAYRFEALDPTRKYQERINPTPSLGKAFRLRKKALQ